MRKVEDMYSEYKIKGRTDEQLLALATAINRPDLKEYVEQRKAVDVFS